MGAAKRHAYILVGKKLLKATVWANFPFYTSILDLVWKSSSMFHPKTEPKV